MEEALHPLFPPDNKISVGVVIGCSAVWIDLLHVPCCRLDRHFSKTKRFPSTYDLAHVPMFARELRGR